MAEVPEARRKWPLPCCWCHKAGLNALPQGANCSLAPDEVSNSGPASSARPGASPQFVTEGVGQASDRDVQG